MEGTMESGATALISIARQTNPVSSSSANYYCHICAVDVVGITNTTSQEVECNNCRSNFVEALGQGLEGFLNPRDTVQSRPTTQSTRHGRSRRTHDRNQFDAPGYHDVPALIDVAQIEREAHVARATAAHGVFSGSFPNNRDRAAGLNNLMNALLGTSRGIFDGNGGPVFGGGPMGMGMAMGAGNVRSFEDLLHHIMMNESSHAGVPPAADVMIETLTREVVTADTNLQRLGECCISMEAFEPGDTAVSLPCGHSYKQEPIVQWLRMHNTCPVCRVQLPMLDESENEIEMVN
jgi:hypothetical protein